MMTYAFLLISFLPSAVNVDIRLHYASVHTRTFGENEYVVVVFRFDNDLHFATQFSDMMFFNVL